MGWGSASSIMSAVIASVQEHVKDPEVRTEIYRPIHDELRAADWDTVDECLGEDPAYDDLIRELHPHWFDDEDDEDDEDGEHDEDEA